MVARQLSVIVRVVANALHDEDLGCGELRHVDEVAADLIGGLACQAAKGLGWWPKIQ